MLRVDIHEIGFQADSQKLRAVLNGSQAAFSSRDRNLSFGPGQASIGPMKRIALFLCFASMVSPVFAANDCGKYWIRDSKKRIIFGPMDGITYVEWCNRDKNCTFPYDIYRLAYGKNCVLHR